MFPHTITIYIFDEEEQRYSRQVVKGVYWYGSQNQSQSGKAISDSFQGNIVIPQALMGAVKVKKGCYIVRGEHEAIESVSELEKYDEKITVIAIDYNDVGSGLGIDNMVIHGV